MQLGLVGLGKMGFNMRERVRRAGHEVIGYDRNPEVSDSESLADMVSKLEAPRVVWVMVPAGEITRNTVKELSELLQPGDLVVDGGNSKFTDDRIHADLLAEKQIGYLDCGVSGGVWGLDNGYALMVGGDAAHVEQAMPIFDALRPEGPREEGFAHAGKVGAGRSRRRDYTHATSQVKPTLAAIKASKCLTQKGCRDISAVCEPSRAGTQPGLSATPSECCLRPRSRAPPEPTKISSASALAQATPTPHARTAPTTAHSPTSKQALDFPRLGVCAACSASANCPKSSSPS